MARYRMRLKKSSIEVGDTVRVIAKSSLQWHVECVDEGSRKGFRAYVQVAEKDLVLERVSGSDDDEPEGSSGPEQSSSGPRNEREVVQSSYRSSHDSFEGSLDPVQPCPLLGGGAVACGDCGVQNRAGSSMCWSCMQPLNGAFDELLDESGEDEGPIEIRILAVYTLDCVVWDKQDVLEIATTGADLLAQNIYQCIDDLNAALENSEIDVYATLVKIEGNEPYVDHGQWIPTAPTDVYKSELLKGRKGQFARVLDLRAYYEADIVLFVVGSASGNAPMGGGLPARNREEAFVVVQYPKLLDEYTPAHEIAHLFGAEHDAGGYGMHPASKGPHDFAHGHVTEHWRTIMAYIQRKNGKPWGATVIPYFSNPDVSYQDEPTGTDVANNAAQIQAYAPTIVSFRG